MTLSPFRRPRATVAALAAATALLAPIAMSAAAPAHAATASPASTKAYAGVIPFTAADVVRLSGTDDWSVSWTAPADVTSVQVFVGTSATDFPATPTTTSSVTTGAVTITSKTRPWVKLQASYGAPLVVSSRSLGLTTDANLRDAGGYRTTTGQWVKEGVILRSQQLSASSLSASDKAAFDGLGISSDYDLRTSCEVFSNPDITIPDAQYVHLNVMGDGTTTEFNATTCAASQLPAGLKSPADAAGYMSQAEIGFVDSDTAKAAYKGLYTRILADKGVSLYHCTAGKDRTGWASAALLTLLGVPADAVMQDYLLSNQYYLTGAGAASIAAANAASPGYGDLIAPMMEVRAEYLQTGLDQVTKEYGSMENYFEKGLGLSAADVAGLRAKLLTGAAIPAATTPVVKPTPTPTTPKAKHHHKKPAKHKAHHHAQGKNKRAKH